MNAAQKNIAVITSVRNDRMFLERWIAYYSKQFCPKSLYVMLDGYDQERPNCDTGVNFISVPYKHREVVAGDKSRAIRASNLAKCLFQNYDIVIAVDIDEFIILDPKLDMTLAQYLSAKKGLVSLSALGLDVVQKMSVEPPIDPRMGLLQQRKFAFISDRYTKASIAFKPINWGSGQHRVKGHNFRIDPNLYLFHFGNVDGDYVNSRQNDPVRQGTGWARHMAKRQDLFEQAEQAEIFEGDDLFASARRRMNIFRPIYALNKPGVLRKRNFIEIPERFKFEV